MAEEKKIEAPAKAAEVTVESKKPAAKKAAAKKPAAKKPAAKKAPVAEKAATKKTTAKKATPAKKATAAAKAPAKKAVAKKASAKKVAKVKKLGKVIFEFDGQQIDYKKIEKKAAKLGGDVYVVINEKKIFDKDGKSVDIF